MGSLMFHESFLWFFKGFSRHATRCCRDESNFEKTPAKSPFSKDANNKKLSHKAKFISETIWNAYLRVWFSLPENTYWRSAIGVGSFRFVEMWKFSNRFASLKVKSWPPKAPDLKTGRAPSRDLGLKFWSKTPPGRVVKWCLMMINYFCWIKILIKPSLFFCCIFFDWVKQVFRTRFFGWERVGHSYLQANNRVSHVVAIRRPKWHKVHWRNEAESHHWCMQFQIEKRVMSGLKLWFIRG